jgi:hypothetical protein
MTRFKLWQLNVQMRIRCYSFHVWLIWTEEILLKLKNMTMAHGICIAVHMWALISADVKAAFLKGDPYVNRELYLTKTNEKVSLPLPRSGQLCRVLKGIFGLADAPPEWCLRLSRSMQGHGWRQSIVDAACWFLSELVDGVDRLAGMIVAHVDDLLFTGNTRAEQSRLYMQSVLNSALSRWILAVLLVVESISDVLKTMLFV